MCHRPVDKWSILLPPHVVDRVGIKEADDTDRANITGAQECLEIRINHRKYRAIIAGYPATAQNLVGRRVAVLVEW